MGIESIVSLIQNHPNYAPILLFFLCLLAGLNIPISIDLLMILAATLAATILPEKLYFLFFSMLFGCIFSAYLAQGIGRVLQDRLFQLPFFRKILSPKRFEKMRSFYKRRLATALLVGRFIPFGVRNGLYYSYGVSRLPFWKFALWDGIACSIWSILSFSIYYRLGKSVDILYEHVKQANWIIFAAFGVTVIGFIWYKKAKRAKEPNV